MILQRLVAEEIDPRPALRERLVSAHLFGTSVQVPDGELVGGTFAEIPGCSAADEAGCVVTWSSYRRRLPAAGRRPLRSIRAEPACTRCAPTPSRCSVVSRARRSRRRRHRWAASRGWATWTTRFVSLPDVVDVSCATAGDIDYLSVALADPDDPRPVGALQTESLGPAWGLHTVDMSIAQDDLVELAARQGAAYAG